MKIVVYLDRFQNLRRDANSPDADKLSIVNRHLICFAKETKRLYGGSITAIMIASRHTNQLLREALARGCDHASIIPDNTNINASITRSVALGVQRLKPNLLVTGDGIMDESTAVLAPQLAGRLGYTYAAFALHPVKHEALGECFQFTRIRANMAETLSVSLPALISVQPGQETDDFISVDKILNALKKTITEVPEINDEKTDEYMFSAFQYLPEKKMKQAKIIDCIPDAEGSKEMQVSDAVDQLIDKLVEEHLV